MTSKQKIDDSPIDFAEKIFAKSVEVFNGFPDLFFITPFRRVAENLTKMMYNIILVRKNVVRIIN